ncbi:putative pyridoxine 4-dehydrogenase [Helianthus annuus]|nr:putative pyridoxine 4-dehydrogenase [Helianthus annuus]
MEYSGEADEIVIATKFAAYPWCLTPNQFVNACKSSLDRLQIDKIGITQLHWSTANYAPLQERALWDGLVAMYDKVQFSLLSMSDDQMEINSVCDLLGIRVIAYSPLALACSPASIHLLIFHVDRDTRSRKASKKTLFIL